ncbi:hypothetical protein RDI58_021312 [Solanum bulbocastanum]|uniref:DUF4094 domain-containing protein n=1 Tax=Solanum bulbocastanum TaxID=147425 RepID=A0AAN8T8H1_SOLBU
MGLKVERSPPYKGARWVSLLCIVSFCLGVFVVNRLLTVPGFVRTVNYFISVEHMSHEHHPVLECEKKASQLECDDTSLVAGDIIFNVSKTHDVIMELKKIISSLEMKLPAARGAKEQNEEIAAVGRKPVIEPLNNRPKVFYVMGIITAFTSRKRRDSIRENLDA